MSIIDSYRIQARLYDGRSVAVYRAREKQGNGKSVILKTLKPGASIAARLRHEFSILKDLALPGVVRALAIEEQGGELAIVLEDLGGETLTARLARGAPSIAEALRIAVDLADAIGRIHHAHVIHKDVNPSNILLVEGERARLFDFDIATRLPREIQSIRTPNLLAGTLPYISPEQTGRMNRAIDYRTDLYSFGATLYVALTGSVPFPSQDPLEIIHCHIAKAPTPPAEVNPSVPVVLSAIVMKLLQKTPEERYQSAFGVKADLEQCLARIGPDGQIEPFPIGQHDVSDQLRIPERLYGREGEIVTLESAFARVRKGKPELLLVTGSSGIGKSSVIQELYRSISQTRGLFVSGKFDQLKRDIPYSALLQALSELARSLLAETDEQLALFRKRILAAASGLGRVLVDFLPDLARVIGPQPPVPELPAAEARNRFRFVFERFLHVFTQHGQPLVIFLDDLQWADAATLDLLPSLLGDKDAGALLLIGSYRDNEVSAGHPLTAAMAEIEAQGCVSTKLTLEPMSVENVSRLVEDTLSLASREAQPLAALLFRRTGGNPLFMGELLTALHKSGMVEFDPARLRWTFDLPRIEQAPSTDNVGQLMAARAAALGEQARETLQLAAVLGNHFDLETLALVAQRSHEEAASALDEALREGLVLSVGQRYRPAYRFLHDRVQQAVYASISAEAKIELHHRVGQLLLENRPQDENDDWLFGVLHHLNLAASQVQETTQRLELATLNRSAAKRARASGAFAAAAGLYAAGTALLPDAAWTTNHELMYTLHLGRAECAYLTGSHAAAESLFDLLFKQVRTDIERVEVYELLATYKAHIWRMREAIDAAREALALLGHKIPEGKRHQIIAEFLRATRALRGRSPRDIVSLPEATSPRTLITIRLFRVAIQIAFFTAPNVYTILCLKAMCFSLEHGLSRDAPTAFFTYGMMLIGLMKDYKKAEQWAQAAHQICARFPDKAVESMLHVAEGVYLRPWLHPAKDALRSTEKSFQCGTMSGELVCACYALCSKAVLLMLTSCPIEEFRLSCEQDLELVRRFKHAAAYRTIQTYLHSILALQGLTLRTGSFDTEDFNEAKHVAHLATYDTKHILYGHWVTRIMVLFVLECYDEAAALSAFARKDAAAVLRANPLTAEFHYFDALLLLRFAEEKSLVARQRDLLLVRGHLRKLKMWGDNAPMNFRHKHLLVAADLARVTGDDRAAIGQYEQAIAMAEENGFLRDAAIGLELASAFYRSRGVPDVAVGYLARARQVYARWGARAKVALLDQAYPGLAARAEVRGRSEVSTISITSSSSASGAIDAPSMVKASQALSGEIALEKLLLRLMNIVAENAGAQRGALVLKTNGVFSIVAEFSVNGGALLPGRSIPLNEASHIAQAIVGYVVRTQESVVLGDASREGAYTNDPYIASKKVRAVLCMPLGRKGTVDGALYLENNLVADAFSQERAEFLSVICGQMAISIENAELYADLEAKVTERTRELREAQARLIQLEKEATEAQMAGGFAHEMRNALAGAKLVLAKIYRTSASGEQVSSCAQNSDRLADVFLFLRDRLAKGDLDEVGKILKEINGREEKIDWVLGNIDRALGRGLGITGMILEYAQIDKDHRGSELVVLEKVVRSILQDIEGDTGAHAITTEVDIPPSCELKGHPLHFYSIIKNLILNARDAVIEKSDEGPRLIQVRAVMDLEHLIVSVSDTGVGIPDGIRDKIFEPFFSTKPSSGTGLGLGMTRKLASLYGGKVEFESEPGRGSTFRVVFPRELDIPTAPDFSVPAPGTLARH